MPGNDRHWRALEQLYLDAPINGFYRPQIRVGEGITTITMEARSEFYHAAGAVHGAVLFKALDDAAYFAVNSLITDVLVLTTEFHLHFLRPVRIGRIVATGTVVSSARRLAVANAEIRLEDQTLVAQGAGSYIRSTVPLGPEVGYRLDR